MKRSPPVLFLVLALIATPVAVAGSIETPPNPAILPSFDIVRTIVTAEHGNLVFSTDVSGTAGAEKPNAIGKMQGSSVYAYVWPTSLDSAALGFDSKQGIVALAVTAHPDFDDTPNYDEDGDGNAGNDGKTWHSHWVVLEKDASCPAGMKVKDVAPGVTVKMPDTAPGVPILLDSPDIRPDLDSSTIRVSVPMPEGGAGMSFDGVTAGLKVSHDMAAPLLCVTDLFKVATEDLSLTGRVSP